METIQPSAALEEAPARFSFFRYLLGLISRAMALWWGAFALFNLFMIGDSTQALYGNMWWVDLSYWPPIASDALLIFFAVFALAYAFRPVMSLPRKITWMLMLGLMTLTVASNGVDYLLLLEAGTFEEASFLPYSLIVLLMMLIMVLGTWLQCPGRGRWRYLGWPMILMTLAAIFLSFPWLQVETLGRTDYRRDAEVALVFGAKAYPNGRCSTTLHDRVMTAVDLYHEGKVNQILMSGGPVNDTMHETEAMRRLAMKNGVPSEAILIDQQGLNTRASTRNTIAAYDLKASTTNEQGELRVLVVSNFYHIPRIRMSFAQEGVKVYSVPAKQKFVYGYTPWMIMRETAAFWVYYGEGIFK